MANQKRSQQYDWFKGPAAKGGPKDRKAQGKKVWKFTKIFIYLALFVFSITGCIQSLILKTTNYVGTGVEFYANRDEVAPHVSQLNVEHTIGTKTTPEIYALDVPSVTNIWLSKDIDVNGQGSLKAVHEAVAKQSSTNPNLRLEDAFKGANDALWINDNNKKFDGVTTTKVGGSDVPLVLSTLADQSVFTPYAASDATLFNKFEYYKADANGVYTGTKFAASAFKSFETDKYTAAKKAELAKTVSNVTGTTVVDLYEDAENKIMDDLKSETAAAGSNASAIKAAADKAAARLKSIQSVASSYQVDVTRQAYSLAILKTVLTTDIKNWLAKDLTTVKAPTKPAAFVKGGNKDAYDASVETYTNYANRFEARNNFIDGLASIFQFEQNDKNVITNGFHFVAGKYPFFSGSTNWRPLVSWGDAWSEGPFYGLFVYPTAYVSANMIAAFPGGMAGWETLITIFVVVFSMRFLAFLLSFKATMQQTRMQELAAKKAVIDAKYAPYKGNKQMENRQRQEVSEMYKKQGVSPFGSMTSIFITMPLFLAIWRTIGALPHIKSAVWLGINFSATSWRELFHGSFQYLPLMILAAGFAAFQQILPRLLTKRRDKTRINVQQKAAMKKGNKTQNIMMLVFVFMSLIFSAGLQVYWIAGGVWMTIQSTLTHFLIIRQSKNRKRNRIKT